ncbi:MAG: phospholipase D-like domain-containing protein [Deltaproteobacteria bacterium]|jgi:cardiolipin synthase|nr:phospholipase D-like domain-containing protein [Deltaproteobacteria bacterium]
MEIFDLTRYWLFWLVIALPGLGGAVHALLNKREPASMAIWVVLCLVLPVLGVLLYAFLGVNRIHRRASKLMLRSQRGQGPGTISAPASSGGSASSGGPGGSADRLYHNDDGEDKIHYPQTGPALPPAPAGRRPLVLDGPHRPPPLPMEVPAALLPSKIRTMARIGYSVMGMPLLGGNRVKALYNGNQAYPDMLEAINQARERIYLGTYIFDNDVIGKTFVLALARAKMRGVEVKVHLDGIGTLLTFPRIDKLLKAQGVDVARFIPPRLLPPQFSINMRNHRKLLLVDGKVGFTGGMNISSSHITDQPVPRRLRERLGQAGSNLSRLSLNLLKFSSDNSMQDIHFRIEGPILEDFQLIFAREWQFSTGELLEPPPVSPEPKGPSLCRTILDGPDDFLERFHSTILGAISAARHTVRIMTPYFLPPRQLITALQSAAMRGVQVEIILPAVADHPFVSWATNNVLWDFIDRGVHIHYQPGPFNHSKLLLIDGYYAHVGSANLDPRSLRLHFELTTEIFDSRVCGELERHFDAIKARSREYTRADLEARSLPGRLRDAFFWLFSPYM